MSQVRRRRRPRRIPRDENGRNRTDARDETSGGEREQRVTAVRCRLTTISYDDDAAVGSPRPRQAGAGRPVRPGYRVRVHGRGRRAAVTQH